MDLPFNIYNFIKDISLVMLACFLLASAFFTYGNLMSKILGINITGTKGIFAKIWLGLTFTIFIFSIYQLLFPINFSSSCIFYFPPIIYFIIYYYKKCFNLLKAKGWLKKIIILFILFATSAIIIQIPTNIDTGLYHLNSIRWLNEHHIIKGLGNLHAKLGFNQLFFVYCASLNFHPILNDYSFHVANGFICSLFFLNLLLISSTIDLILLCLFFFIPMPYSWISSPTPDIASTFLQIIAFRYFIETIHINPNSKNRSSYIAFAAIISALLITIKLSNIIFGLGVGITTILYSKKYLLLKNEKKLIGKTFIFIILLFLVWITRGYIQTGYPLFPSSFGKINFKWTVPEIIAKIERDCIYAGSRSCERTFKIDSPLIKNYTWIPHWLKTYFFDEKIYWSEDPLNNLYTIIALLLFPSTIYNWGIGSISLCCLSIIMLVIWLIALNKNKNLFYKSNMLLSILLIEVVSLVFWFFTAPCPRFTNGIPIIMFITNLLLIKSAFPYLTINKRRKKYLILYFLIMLIWNFSISYFTSEFYINGIKILAKAPMKEYIMDSGLKVLSPKISATDIWDSELPATPNRIDSLSLINNSLDEGFYIRNKCSIKVNKGFILK